MVSLPDPNSTPKSAARPGPSNRRQAVENYIEANKYIGPAATAARLELDLYKVASQGEPSPSGRMIIDLSLVLSKESHPKKKRRQAK